MTRTSPTSGTAETAAPSKREGWCTSVWSPRATVGQVAIAAINAAAISPETARARAAGTEGDEPPGATGASVRATCSRKACTSVGDAPPRELAAGAPASSTADSRSLAISAAARRCGGRPPDRRAAPARERARRGPAPPGRARPRSRPSPWARNQRGRPRPPTGRARTARRPAPPRRSPPPGGRRAAGAAAARPRGSSGFRPARSSPAPNRINFGPRRGPRGDVRCLSFPDRCRMSRRRRQPAAPQPC